jgi:serine/threonine protein kinase
MEHLEGGDLRDHMTQGKVTLTEKVAILGDILRALDVIHAAGVTHRDLKPQNLMFRRGGDLVLVDFGISHVSGALTASSHELVGTPVYVSPEQVLGQRTDARSDLYSVGAIFFEMLTGRHAYTGGTVSEILRKHVHDAPPRLPLDFSQFQDMSDRLLAKVPTERFQSARQALRYVHDRWLSQVASDPGGRPAPSRRH